MKLFVFQFAIVYYENVSLYHHLKCEDTFSFPYKILHIPPSWHSSSKNMHILKLTIKRLMTKFVNV